MRRRELMLLLGGVMAMPRALRAQQKAIPVIGFLGSASPGPFAPMVAAFHQGLSETGYVEGKTWGSSTAGPSSSMIGCPHWPPTSSPARLR